MTQTAAETKARIRWQAWGPELFRRARRADKLILLDSGATWCHWCHVMDRVTYEDPHVVRLINETFLPVRIDRDRLPDVDAHYQRAAALINPRPGAGGWPLTVVITPEGHTLFKATFLPPRADPRYGARVGLVDLLETLDAEWRKNRGTIREAGERVGRELADHLAAACAKPDLTQSSHGREETRYDIQASVANSAVEIQTRSRRPSKSRSRQWLNDKLELTVA